MGTFAYVQVSADSEHESNAILDEVFMILEQVENDLSRFRPNSRVSEINRLAASSDVQLNASVFDLLKLCQQLYIKSGGTFDITVQPMVDLWRQSVLDNKMPSAETIQRYRNLVGMNQVRLDDSKQSVRFFKQGIGIDLGAIGKGYALDLVRDQLSRHQSSSAIINLGGNILQINGALETFSIRHPLDGDRIIESIPVKTHAISTSSNQELSYSIEGRIMGHLLDLFQSSDPDILSVTVAADSAIMADALSTCLFLMKKKDGLELAKQMNIHSVVMVYKKSKFWNSKSIRIERYQLQKRINESFRKN